MSAVKPAFDRLACWASRCQRSATCRARGAPRLAPRAYSVERSRPRPRCWNAVQANRPASSRCDPGGGRRRDVGPSPRLWCHSCDPSSWPSRRRQRGRGQAPSRIGMALTRRSTVARRAGMRRCFRSRAPLAPPQTMPARPCVSASRRAPSPRPEEIGHRLGEGASAAARVGAGEASNLDAQRRSRGGDR